MNTLWDISYFILKNVITKFKLTREILNKNILHYSVLESSRDKLQEYVIKSIEFRLKNRRWPSHDFQIIFQGQSNDTSYVPLETIQLLSEIFLSAGLSFRDILLSKLKWDTLYISRLTTEIKQILLTGSGVRLAVGSEQDLRDTIWR